MKTQFIKKVELISQDIPQHFYDMEYAIENNIEFTSTNKCCGFIQDIANEVFPEGCYDDYYEKERRVIEKLLELGDVIENETNN